MLFDNGKPRSKLFQRGISIPIRLQNAVCVPAAAFRTSLSLSATFSLLSGFVASTTLDAGGESENCLRVGADLVQEMSHCSASLRYEKK